MQKVESAARAASTELLASDSSVAYSTRLGPGQSGPSQTDTAPDGHTPEQPTLRVGALASAAASNLPAPLRQHRFPVHTVIVGPVSASEIVISNEASIFFECFSRSVWLVSLNCLSVLPGCMRTLERTRLADIGGTTLIAAPAVDNSLHKILP